MRLELTLPEWAEERHIRIFAGMEEVARKLNGGPLQVKVGRCQMCGTCCKEMPQGPCEHLVYSVGHGGHLCSPGGIAYNRPFSCSTGDGSGKPYCSVTWKDVDGG